MWEKLHRHAGSEYTIHGSKPRVTFVDFYGMYPEVKRLFLLDGSAIAYRSHFALAANPLVNKSGLVTSSIYGFIMALNRIIENEQPDYLAVVFDHKDKTFRHTEYPEYKATREKMPDDLKAQLPYIKEVVEAMRIPFISISGFEADDVIGTLATQAAKKNIAAYMVTGDKDFLQLLRPDVYIYNIKQKGELDLMGEEAPIKKWGIPAKHVTDMLALMGDASDNIPGVAGIGEKTASKLVQDYGSLEEIFEKIGTVKPDKVREKLIANKESAFLSKRLATICTDVELPVAADELKPAKADGPRLAALYRELEFHSLLKKIDDPVELKTSSAQNYHMVKTKAELDDLVKNLSTHSFTFDTETDGLHPVDVQMLATSFAYEKSKAHFISFAHSDFSKSEFIEKIKPVMENPKISKGGQNVKFDRHVYKNQGVNVQGITFDTMLESYLLDPNGRQHGLDDLAIKHLNLKKIPFTEVSVKGQLFMDQVDIQKLSHYACEDADACFQLHQIFKEKIKEQNLERLYHEVELPLIEVLGDMEKTGFALDLNLLSELSKKLTIRLNELTKQIIEAAGEEFNIKSPKQMGPILFEKLKVQEAAGITKIKKTKTGYATDQETLEKFDAHPIIRLILEYRNLSKLQSTYIDSLPSLVHPKTGRVHTSFNQTVAATGRLSSSDPNLQNIPIRTELGREIRKAFVAQNDNLIVSADYSQIELRFLSHLTKDPTLVRTFEQNEDVHTITAALIFNKSFHEVTPELRSRAKTINFGVIYGMGPQRLARENGISIPEAKKFIESYFQTYGHVKDFFSKQLEFAREHGYVETIMGRRRPLPDINGKNPMMVAIAERMAGNTPLQGSAADLIKIAMINIHNEIKKRNLKTRMLLQVHDELVFEVPPDELKEAMEMIKDKMETAMKLDVPLLVDIRSGQNW
ncbi:MAG: DNA polymerase I, partial [Proteobacteria bacterium]|nr:DNA polymerase I [Pseudomonadota bacterium]